MKFVSRHHTSLLVFFLIVLASHWIEHLVQAVQVFYLGWPRPSSLGVLGYYFPWLVQTEWLHFGHAVFTMVMLVLLRHPYGAWWTASIWINVWHLIEHTVLFVQASVGVPLMSIAQVLIPRVELHLIYNILVLIPMAVAVYLERRPWTCPDCGAADDPPGTVKHERCGGPFRPSDLFVRPARRVLA